MTNLPTLEGNIEIEQLFVSYQIASQLKRLDFNYPCLAYRKQNELVFESPYGKVASFYNSEWLSKKTSCAAAPLYQQVIHWLKKEHNITVFWTFNQKEFEKRIKDALKQIK